jgi:hypothetical protein
MFKSSVARRARAVLIALAITFMANYAISYAAKSGTPNPENPPPKPRAELLDRSGTPNPENPPPRP